jgi:CheY-like chemotaxis protein
VDIKRARIVVVEDEAVMSTFILNTLRRIGILDLYAFTDGASALKEGFFIDFTVIFCSLQDNPVFQNYQEHHERHRVV